jgi:hypothetical protein
MMGARSVWQLCFALACLVQLQSAAAFYHGTDVVTLTGSNFESKIKSGGVWLVEVSTIITEHRVPCVVPSARAQQQHVHVYHKVACINYEDTSRKGAARDLT